MCERKAVKILWRRFGGVLFFFLVAEKVSSLIFGRYLGVGLERAAWGVWFVYVRARGGIWVAAGIFRAAEEICGNVR